ncbi:MAG TPA: 1-acyl-sn-glycerol-3-phosphate acyltransferase [Bacteroidales bacterium]|nr:1-acyl-sn-glycerol-3-phosphate acyltransferase [Bacteroidales bacterium]HNZ41775.1 1-acyl-sn-glycerol-3-phosphate acyltransferase [Bacteroidales bacterium]HOH83802.1 1-acyl-sn-glycerol-3-phosphate acyltransferase [Bacteroidales bacterium]HPB24413.1 1-acyl-sn-glycerol-3-phosphate acyltransferase [Bacteroidales bacterium]HPI29321.1 1-acyl-sn-glycerol-3-phosphate acyltransferase [Bacteroidales bacterium]
MKHLSRLVLKLFGWRPVYQLPEGISNCILLVAPHTSFWDFPIGRFSASAFKLHVRFLIKKEYFRFPLKHFLMWIGGIPVDREHGSNVAKHIVDVFKSAKNLCLVITPEGTRKYTERWKKGYYFIATAAQVPIVLCYVDYKEKVCCVSDVVIYPSGNYEEDFKIIEKFYKGRVAKYPEKFNLS